MNILEQIAENTALETALLQKVLPITELEKSHYFGRNCLSLSQSIRETTGGIIAEHKRRSPSRPIISQGQSIIDVVKGYESAGAAGLSVLTDMRYFGGSATDLLLARSTVKTPILRKDFMLTEYQVLHAKAMGADAVLLIAALLEPHQIRGLAQLAASLGMESLLEVHDIEELERSICPEVQMVGVNNRNLKSFELALQNSLDLAAHIPIDFVKISESGIASSQEVKLLQDVGFDGFLMGSHLMLQPNPGKALAQFLKALEHEN